MENILSYDHYIVCFSGGKDCTASFLHLLEKGVPKNKIELWHHDVDGKEETFMDWPVTPAYVKAFAAHFEVPVYFSWKEGGFEKEMLREEEYTSPILFEKPDGTLGKSRKGNGKKSTRRKFPQVSADLSVRWCSAYLKIDVCSTAICNQERFNHKKVLVISGERGEESPCRAKYQIYEKDRADNRFRGTYKNSYYRQIKGKSRKITTTITLGRNDRLVDRFRPVKDWKEEQVWEIIERHNVRVHPCYYLGWNRCSCRYCIFGDKNQFASAYFLAPNHGDKIISYEKEFGCTIKRKQSLSELIQTGKVYPSLTSNPSLQKLANSTTYPLSIHLENWTLPAGAYGEGNGPS